MMRNAFYYILKALFVLKMFKFFVFTFWSCRKKLLDKKDKVNLKIYDITNWLANNYNTRIVKHFTKKMQPDN